MVVVNRSGEIVRSRAAEKQFGYRRESARAEVPTHPGGLRERLIADDLRSEETRWAADRHGDRAGAAKGWQRVPIELM